MFHISNNNNNYNNNWNKIKNSKLNLQIFGKFTNHNHDMLQNK